MIRTFLLDDEKPAIDELHYLLKQFPDIEIIGEALTAKEAIPIITKEQPDLIFLDIEMRGLSGLEIAEIIQSISPQSQIVFATAYDHYALKAFELNVTDYILKPFEEDRINMAIKRVINNLEERNAIDQMAQNQEQKNLQSNAPDEGQHKNQSRLASQTATADFPTGIGNVELPHPSTSPGTTNTIAVEKDGRIYLIDNNSITYITIDADTSHLQVNTLGGIYSMNKTLSQLQEYFTNTNLYRVHRSYIVNLNQVKEVIPWFKGTYWLRIPKTSPTELIDIPVSKSQVKNIKTLLGIQ